MNKLGISINRKDCEMIPEYAAAGFEVMEDHESFMKQAAPFIITTHLSDYDGEDEKHWMPGAGVVPWKLVYDKMTEAGYQGPWLFELGCAADGNPLDPFAVLSSWKKESGIE